MKTDAPKVVLKCNEIYNALEIDDGMRNKWEWNQWIDTGQNCEI